ncbi:MAG: hypothetical protein PVH88_05855 [Ignavibacteria bacterium]|jgi:hypothetical protein
MIQRTVVVILFFFLLNHLVCAQEIIPLRNTHSHNDYHQTNPLFDALNNGICSIEADIFLVDNELFVAHESDEISKNNTLKKLYLEPLNEIIKSNNEKYMGLFPIQLLIDIKSEALPTYLVLHYQLKEYKSIVTTYTKDGNINEKEINVVISGDRPKKFIKDQKERYCAIDGRIEDIEKESFLYPLISDHCMDVLEYLKVKPTDYKSIKNKLKSFADKIHGENKKVRLWAVPDNAEHWSLLYNTGIDFIGTDKPAELREYLLTLKENKN